MANTHDDSIQQVAVSMNAFTADRDRTVYMGEATHSKTTANKPKQGEMKMKTATQKIDEAIERDNETGYACGTLANDTDLLRRMGFSDEELLIRFMSMDLIETDTALVLTNMLKRAGLWYGNENLDESERDTRVGAELIMSVNALIQAHMGMIE